MSVLMMEMVSWNKMDSTSFILSEEKKWLFLVDSSLFTLGNFM